MKNWPRNTALYNWLFQLHLSAEIDGMLNEGKQVRDHSKFKKLVDSISIFGYWMIVIVMAFILYFSARALRDAVQVLNG